MVSVFVATMSLVVVAVVVSVVVGVLILTLTPEEIAAAELVVLTEVT